jgi:serine/threonine-protein kinase HipA
VSPVAEVRLWGRTIGAVSLDASGDVAAFEYDPAFAGSGIQVAPLMMPLSRRIYRFPQLSRQTFHGLPGLLADSLPDKFGNALIDAWLAQQGRTADSFNALERLCYTGERGMGALEYAPARGPVARKSEKIQVDKLVELASRILTHRNGLQAVFGGDTGEAGGEAEGEAEREGEVTARALTEILRVGTSAGGARAKAVIAWNPVTEEVRSGQVAAEPGFEHWLLKFDGVSGNKDKELEDPAGYGVIEYAYFLMARDCGIEIEECRLLEENGRRHFMTRRFDRPRGGGKLHMQSLCAMAHYDFNLAGAHSYEQALLVIRQLGLPMSTIEQQFRRMAFNIVARNQDDHVKNIAFLMDKGGNWSLSPAFDVTYSYNPSGAWTASHQMTLNGKRDGFTLEDFRRCAKVASMKRGRAEAIVDEVRETVRCWNDYADAAGLDAPTCEQIRQTLRLEDF